MFEKSTWIKLPRNVVMGHGVLTETGDAVDDLGLMGRPLVVTSPTPNRLVGDVVREQLASRFSSPSSLEIDDASFEAVADVVDHARDVDAAFLVALGGGKPIDTAKMAADRLGCPFVSIPTTASHDGIVSGRSSIPEGDTRHSVAADPPVAVVADTEVLSEAPWELTTAGCADIISNYTAVKDWQLAHRLKNVEYSEYAGSLAQMTAEMLVEAADSIRPELEESSWIVMKALVSSGVAMSIAGSSRPASGAEHLFSHQLDRLCPGVALHGHQVGVGSILCAYLHEGERGQWMEIKRALESLGAPTTAHELGIDEETLVEALTTAHEIRDRYTILGDGVSEEAAIEAASVTDVV